MNYRGLKQAARQCLRDSACDPRRLTLLYLLCAYGVQLAVNAVTIVLELRLSRLSGLAAVGPSGDLMLWVTCSDLAVTTLMGLWTAGYTLFCLHLSRGQAAGFQDFLAGFRQLGRVLALLLLRALFIFLWSMLLVIPGLVAVYRYSMALNVLLDDPQLTASEAIQVSSRLTYGHKLELFILDLHFLWYVLPLAAVQTVVMLYQLGWLPPLPLSTVQARAVDLLAQILPPLIMGALFMAYIDTTHAHAYNYLRTLDRQRREEARRFYSGPAG